MTGITKSGSYYKVRRNKKLYPHIKTEENKGLILYKVENAAFEPSVALCDSLSLFF